MKKCRPITPDFDFTKTMRAGFPPMFVPQFATNVTAEQARQSRIRQQAATARRDDGNGRTDWRPRPTGWLLGEGPLK